MPGTSVSASTLAKGPWESRYSTIRWARAGPIPGSFSSSDVEAVLILTDPEEPPPSGLPEAALVPEPAAPADWGAGSGRTSPTRGTRICSPSVRTRARLSCSASASGAAPPAALMASVTRLPVPRITTPGLVTAPVTWMTTLLAPALGPPGACPPGPVAVPAIGPAVDTAAEGRAAAVVPAAAGIDSPPAAVEVITARSARTTARIRRTEPATTAALGAIARRRGRRTGSSGSVEHARRTRSSRDRFPVLLLTPMPPTLRAGAGPRTVAPSALWRALATGCLWQPDVVVSDSEHRQRGGTRRRAALSGTGGREPRRCRGLRGPHGYGSLRQPGV